MRKNWVLLACMLVVGAVLAMSGTAWPFVEGYGQPWGAESTNLVYSGADCPACHGFTSTQITEIQQNRKGPHGGFADTTDYCGSCHDVHEARDAVRLLIGPTIFETCNTCHDLSFSGTGGSSGGGGVYGAIRARGLVVGSRHNVVGYNNTDTVPSDGSKSYEATSLIPGATASLDETLSCGSCHTPHGNTDMAAYLGHRWRMNSYGTTISSNKILRDDVGGAPRGTYAVYGADWCAGCHDRRHSGTKGVAGVNNHPVDQTDAPYLDPSMSAGGLAWPETATADGTLPARIAGWSREATDGWAPMCQQCHNNTMDAESPWQVTKGVHMGPGVTDGRVATDNPRFQLFPHETMNRSFLVETGDDLCLNCHSTAGLP